MRTMMILALAWSAGCSSPENPGWDTQSAADQSDAGAEAATYTCISSSWAPIPWQEQCPTGDGGTD